MRRRDGRRRGMLAVMTVLLVGACGSGDDTGPTTRLAIAKAATKSGDLQTGVTGEALPDALRIIVTRDGEPESGVTVTWSTGDGALDPASGETDDEGVSTSTWTLGDTPGTMTATASVTNASGSPVSFTATATSGGPSGTIVQVLSDGGTRFAPSAITVTVGTTVTWVWGTINAVAHNVTPNNGVTPTKSGPLVTAPHQYLYTFNTVGTFGYHCEAHPGMTGTVTVVTEQP